MDKPIKEVIDNLNRTGSLDEDLEFLDVATETQMDILHVSLQGIFQGVDIGEREAGNLAVLWNHFHSNVYELIYLVRYYEHLLKDEEIPDDLQKKIERWDQMGQERHDAHRIVTNHKYNKDD